MSTNFAKNCEKQDLIQFSSDFFSERFKSKPTIYGIAPGRVNLIGEHIDYNDGFVLPMAIPYFTVIVGRKNNTNQCNILTTCSNLDEEPKEVSFAIPVNENQELNLLPGKPMWLNYIKGVMVNFKGNLHGFDAVILTNVPVGVGLSSSAALEVATYYFLEELDNTTNITCKVEKAKTCQKAENDFLGMPCGIMDQFISCLGKTDHAVLLDCRSLHYEYITLIKPEIKFLITSTNIRHKLAESQYKKRKEDCERAARILGKTSLRDVTMAELEKNRENLGDVYQRVLHVVGEIQRTLEAAEAMRNEDYFRFGQLMVESHKSLRLNYEVSCIELDTVVKAALEVQGVFGSRMTGGGFGGCTVTLLREDAVEKTIDNIKKNYSNPTFYTCRPCDGAYGISM